MLGAIGRGDGVDEGSKVGGDLAIGQHGGCREVGQVRSLALYLLPMSDKCYDLG